MGDCAFTHIALEDENFDSLGTMISGWSYHQKTQTLPIESGRSDPGPTLRTLQTLGCETNFKKLYASLDQEGLQYEVIDASYLLTLDDFAAPNTIDETCRYSGRQKIMP